MEPKANYDFEAIDDKTVAVGATPGVRYRIRDAATDNAIASCVDRVNAQLVVDALNALGVDYMTYFRAALRREEQRV